MLTHKKKVIRLSFNYFLLFFILSIFIASPLYADAALPPVMSLWGSILFWIFAPFLYFVIIELVVYYLTLPIKLKTVILPTFISNIITIIVITIASMFFPLAGFLLAKTWPILAVEYYKIRMLLVLIFGLIPIFFLTGIVKYYLLKKHLKLDSDEIKNACWKTNLISYSIICILILIFFLK